MMTSGAGLPNSRLFARDFNGDGKSYVLGFGDGSAIVMLGNGDGTLGAPLASAAPGLLPTDVAFADIDGNGHLDAVLPSTSLVGILLGHGDGTFSAPLYFEAGVDVTTLNVGDVDHDGRLDILVNNRYDRLSVLHGRCLQ